MAKKKIKMRIVDDYRPDTKEDFYNNSLIKSLQEKFDIEYSSNPDFIIYSQEGFKHLNYDCVRIFYTGENIRADFNVADYAIDFDYMDFGDRHLRHTLFDYKSVEKSRPLSDSNIESKSKFCCMLASNCISTASFRGIFFDKLNAYKRVDSGGAYKNNIGHRIENKIEWLKDYTFNICFENSSYPGYLSEKLADAFIAGCVPIYWGDTSLRVGVKHTEPLDSIESNKEDSMESSINGGGG
ncbi:glycosyltransferase family 10 domain-containing protein [Helicobacter saguini]|nr:glycosyltransferase family 10 [Helicobacter saguini]